MKPEALVASWLGERLDAEIATPEELSALGPPVVFGCLVPSCSERQLNRGLCSAHYQKFRYFESRKKLNEGWSVRNGKLRPRRGLTVESYALSFGLPFDGRETLETLPSALPNDREDTKWMFGWPAAQRLRAQLEGTYVQ